jgi:hypothetical protein
VQKETMDEKQYTEMTREELREAIAEYERGARPVQSGATLPPGITAQDSPKAQETASQLYAESILAKPAGSWTPAEREFIRANIGSALRDLGY